jgi:hypothetical protein
LPQGPEVDAKEAEKLWAMSEWMVARNSTYMQAMQGMFMAPLPPVEQLAGNTAAASQRTRPSTTVVLTNRTKVSSSTPPCVAAFPFFAVHFG